VARDGSEASNREQGELSRSILHHRGRSHYGADQLGTFTCRWDISSEDYQGSADMTLTFA
jgi:hypothetical protein